MATTDMPSDLTPDEIEAEWRYRYHERLGICCEDGDPTASQRRLAKKEADEWKELLSKNTNNL